MPQPRSRACEPGLSQTPPTGKILLDALKAIARAHQLNLEIQSVENGLVRISGKNLDFDVWTGWLGQVQQEQGLTLTQADLTQDNQGITIEALLSSGS